MKESNYNIQDIYTHVDYNKLESLLLASRYNKQETSFLVNGFKEGFSIGLEGPTKRQNTSRNIPFQPGVGNQTDM